jgi:hypothetical protein
MMNREVLTQASGTCVIDGVYFSAEDEDKGQYKSRSGSLPVRLTIRKSIISKSFAGKR